MSRFVDVLKTTFSEPLRTTMIEGPESSSENSDTVRKSDSLSSQGAGSAPQTPVTRNFKLVFLSVLGIFLLTLGAQVWIVIAHQEPVMGEPARDLVSYLRTIASAGAGTIFGLMGGKLA